LNGLNDLNQRQLKAAAVNHPMSRPAFSARQVGSAPGMITRINQQYSIAENKGKRTVHVGFSRDVLGSGVKVQASSNLVGRAGI
jgi:hypothetical protein